MRSEPKSVMDFGERSREGDPEQRTIRGRPRRVRIATTLTASRPHREPRSATTPTRSPPPFSASTASRTAPTPDPINTITRSASGAPWYSTSEYCRPVTVANRSIAACTTSGTAAWNGVHASRAWKNTSGFWALPRSIGRSGSSPRERCACTRSSSIMALICSTVGSSTVFSSWLVRNPSKKCRKGTRQASVAACAMTAMSAASCTLGEQSIAKPVVRAAITSLWSPKMLSACVASERAATWMTVGVSSPAILNISGSINSSPWLAVKVVASAPRSTAPCKVAAAPASLCISITSGTTPHRLGWPLALHSSAYSPMAEAGVIG